MWRKPAIVFVAWICAATGMTPVLADHEGPLPFDRVIEPGFAAVPYATGIPTPAALSFGPDGHLYVASWGTGTILRLPDAGGTAGPPEVVVAGLDRPLGLAWGPRGWLYVTSVDPDNSRGARPWGMVSRYRVAGSSAPIDAGSEGQKILVDIPGGIHTVSGLAFGRDGLVYVGNASASENGDSAPGEVREVEPVTMAVLRVDPRDARGRPLSAVDDPVDVVAGGIHNPHDLAFRGPDLYTASNGPQGQEPLGEDLLVRMADAPRASLARGSAYDFGSPGCLYTHDEVGRPVGRSSTFQSLPDAERTCEGRDRPAAALGLHRGATGLAFAPRTFGRRGGDLFVVEFGSLPGFSSEVQGHKVVRVGITESGAVRRTHDGFPDISDFLVSAAPIDIAFRDGTMYVADFGGEILRVEAVPSSPPNQGARLAPVAIGGDPARENITRGRERK